MRTMTCVQRSAVDNSHAITTKPIWWTTSNSHRETVLGNAVAVARDVSLNLIFTIQVDDRTVFLSQLGLSQQVALVNCEILCLGSWCIAGGPGCHPSRHSPLAHDVEHLDTQQRLAPAEKETGYCRSVAFLYNEPCPLDYSSFPWREVHCKTKNIWGLEIFKVLKKYSYNKSSVILIINNTQCFL